MRKKKRRIAAKPKRKGLSAQSRAKRRKSPHNSTPPSLRTSAKSRNRKKSSKTLLTGFPRKRPGPAGANPIEVLGRAYDLEGTLRGCWNQDCWEKDCIGWAVEGESRKRKRLHQGCWDWIDWRALRRAGTEEEAHAAFAIVPEFWQRKLLPYWGLMIEVLNDPKFPKLIRKSQIRFIADSLAGAGQVSPRRSRDICAKTRNIPPHRILREEFYIECSCGYRGPALNGVCPHAERPNTWLEQ